MLSVKRAVVIATHGYCGVRICCSCESLVNIWAQLRSEVGAAVMDLSPDSTLVSDFSLEYGSIVIRTMGAASPPTQSNATTLDARPDVVLVDALQILCPT